MTAVAYSRAGVISGPPPGPSDLAGDEEFDSRSFGPGAPATIYTIDGRVRFGKNLITRDAKEQGIRLGVLDGLRTLIDAVESSFPGLRESVHITFDREDAPEGSFVIHATVQDQPSKIASQEWDCYRIWNRDAPEASRYSVLGLIVR